MKKWLIFVYAFALLLLTNLTYAQQAAFPYSIGIDTVVGDCFNNCQAVVTLYNSQGQAIQTDDSLQHPVDSVAYPITNLQYHYKNQLLNSVFYSNSHILTMDVGVYDIGVSGYVMVNNVPVPVDTTLYGIPLTSTYTPFSASALAIIADNDVWQNGVRRERYGNRHDLSCGDRGRVQLKMMSGNFPYTVDFINENLDTISHKVFTSHQHNGTDSLYADYIDYYTFDSLPAGSYRIVAHDACSYTIVLHYTVGLVNFSLSGLYYLPCAPSNTSFNTVRFALNFSYSSIHNYDYEYLAGQFHYRFIHPDSIGQPDTTDWRPIDPSSISNINSGFYCDTLHYIERYCDMYGTTIRFEVQDFCQNDTLHKNVTITPINPNLFGRDSIFTTTCLSQIEADTCSTGCDSLLRFTAAHTISYSGYHTTNFTSGSSHFFYTRPLTWTYTDSSNSQIIKTENVTYPWSTSSLTRQEVENIYGAFDYIAIPVIRTLTDAQGCLITTVFDTLVYTKDTTNTSNPYVWSASCNYSNTSCYYHNRTITFREYPTPYPNYRDSVVVRLIESPLYDKYNFTATYHNGQWTIVEDDSVANDAEIIPNGMSIMLRSDDLSGGRYIFVWETVCGSDTVEFNVIGAYDDSWEWIEDPEYMTEQECNDLYVTPVAGRYIRYRSYINPYVSNDEPVVTSSTYNPNIQVVSGVAGGYSASSTSMNSSIKFTIPGDYVMRMYFTGCGQTYSRYDTIHFQRILIDFEKAYAVVCDSVAGVGSVIARATNGSTPYMYKLYSQPDMHGTLLGTSATGLFYNVNMNVGQELSIYVVDSCESSYYINVVAMTLEQSQLLWFNGAQPVPGACVGETLHLEALPFNEFITYNWSGPGNFSASGQEADFYVADTSYSGWISVELQNTGCQAGVSDSIYLNVLTNPYVLLSSLDTVCAGDSIVLQMMPHGNGNIRFNLIQSSAGAQTQQSFTGTSPDTLTAAFQVDAGSMFWTGSVSDMYCPSTLPSDTVHVALYPVPDSTEIPTISAPNQLVCYGRDATLVADFDATSSYVVNWYDNALQGTLLQQDTIHGADESSTYTIPQLTTDTTLYVIVWNSEGCPLLPGRIDQWVNMQNGSCQLLPGQGIRIYDSGGSDHAYGHNENLTYTVQVDGAGYLIIHFLELDIPTGDTLYLYDESGATLAVLTDTSIPDDIVVSGSVVTLHFSSNQMNAGDGWGLEILSSLSLATINAEVVRFADTLATTVCQSEEPFQFPPFDNIDITQVGYLHLDTLLFSEMGCDSMVTVDIEVLPVRATTLDTLICEGQTFHLGDNGYSEEGTYLGTFTAANGCDSVVTLNLEVMGARTEMLSSEEDFCERYETILSIPDPSDEYEWSTGETSPSITVTSPGTYTVNTLRQGCDVAASIIIPPCDFELYLPNVITPGRQDGLNDVFSLQDRQKFLINEFELLIFNRWGEVVYSAHDKNFSWDGSVNGQIYPNNVYNYTIFLTDREGRKYFYKGSLTVLG